MQKEERMWERVMMKRTVHLRFPVFSSPFNFFNKGVYMPR